MKKLNSILFLLLFCISCMDRKEAPVNKWELDTNTRYINPNDTPFQNATRKAQDGIPHFKELFAANSDSLDFVVKCSFSDQAGVEHMWVDVYEIKGDSAFGTLDNDPIRVKNVQFGDTVRLAFRQVEDFTIYRGDSVVHGSFLNRLLRN